MPDRHVKRSFLARRLRQRTQTDRMCAAAQRVRGPWAEKRGIGRTVMLALLAVLALIVVTAAVLLAAPALASVGLSPPRCPRTRNVCAPSGVEAAVPARRTSAQRLARLARRARICAPELAPAAARCWYALAAGKYCSWRYCRAIRLY